MRTLALAVIAVAFATPSFAQDKQDKAPPGGGDPMAGWAPRKVSKEAADKKEIMAVFKAMEEAGQKGDLEAAAALVDFPVLMVTDDSKGEAMSGAWSKEQWKQVMEPFYKKPMGDFKVTHKPIIFMVTDSLASVDDQQTMTMHGKKVATRTTSLLVRRGGKWLVKSMVEGGWGDSMKEAPQGASQATGSSGTGAAGAAEGSAGSQPAPKDGAK
jgi:uncharacterized protein (TIGR02246 family)